MSQADAVSGLLGRCGTLTVATGTVVGADVGSIAGAVDTLEPLATRVTLLGSDGRVPNTWDVSSVLSLNGYLA